MPNWQVHPNPTRHDGLTAYEREKRAAAPYRRQDQAQEATLSRGKTEFDVLKENHRFIRDDEDPSTVSYEERLARAYESKLFKEYALIDLKHYKTRQIALRWRTAEEVLASIGETTCASLRCPYHNPSPEQLSEMDERGIDMPSLQAFELPFAYVEAGEKKQALVKVKVCDKCARKITYRPSESESTSRRRHDSDPKRRSDRYQEKYARTASPEASRRGGKRHSRRSDSPQNA
ncbi:hypothetical protein NCC49_003542 [Naganishia albida]|nr:hypothetical protein NCC49_003542 [Naganishia albida]